MRSIPEQPPPDASPASGGEAPRSGRSTRPLAELQTVARGSVANIIGLLVSAPLQLVLVVVIARELGTSGTGLFFSAVALFTIVSNAGELGADTGLVRQVSRYRSLGRAGDVRQTVLVGIAPVVMVGIALAVLQYVFAPQLAAVFSRGRASAETASYFRLLAPFVPVASACTVILSATRGFGTMAPYVWIQNVGLPVVRPAVIAVGIFAGLGGAAIITAWAVPLVPALAAALFTLSILLRRNEALSAPRSTTTPWRRIAKDFWAFAAPRALAAMFGITITWLDILLVGALGSARDAGIYASVSRLSMIGAYALNAIGMAIAPQLSSLLAARREREVEVLFQIATCWLMALTWPLYLTMAVFGDVVLRAFGGDFAAGYTALVIVAVAQLVNLGTGNVTIVLLMSGRSSLALINSFIALALNVALNLLLIPRLGIVGAAIAWAASIVFNNLAALIEVRMMLGIRPFGRGYRLIAIASVVCFGGLGVAFRWLLGSGAWSLGAFAVVAVSCYASLLWALRDSLELQTFVRSVARRGLSRHV